MVFLTPPSWAEEAVSLKSCASRYSAKLVSLQGSLFFDPESKGQWQPAELNQQICEGSRVRTENYSRASIALPNGIILKLDQNTVISLNGFAPQKKTLMDMAKGFVHFISRTPTQLQITTPIANAGPEGTEFALSVDDQKASLWVYEGGVKFFNAKGDLHLKPGESAITQLGQAPRNQIDLRPQDAVNWALYYPPILPYPDASTLIDSQLRSAIEQFRASHVEQALTSLDNLTPEKHNAYFYKIRAAMRLTIGRIELANQDIKALQIIKPNDAEAFALQAIMALTQNRKDEALQLAQRAIASDPQSASAHSALSYVEQARFNLDKAQAAADQATKLAPHDAMVWARKAELQLSQGATADSKQTALRALALDPNLERTQTITGFAYLLRMDTDEALQAFNKAITLDSNSPLARLGLGLAKIRNGDLAEGRQDLEIAAILDPNNSLIRSYLGKAYYEEKRNRLAEDQFGLAKLRDDKDPTPWFYDAIKKQSENRPVEALQNLEQAIKLNGNRAVNRSSELLDQDLAARGAALGRIYNEVGFSQRGLVEGWKAVAQDPTDYTSHRLLSDSYSALPRHDLARSSELLQSQLLQPINITPVQPRLAESQLFLLGGLGPSDLSFNEFNPLFQRNRFSLLASGLIGGNNTYSDEIVQSGLWKDFSYSLGQFHYQTDGFRRNNDINANIYNAFAQYRISPKVNVQAEYRRREVDRGNLASFFNPTPGQQFSIDEDRRRSEFNTYRFGVHISPTAQSDLLGSFMYIDQSATNYSLADGADSADKINGFINEVQHIQRFDSFKSILGGGYYNFKTPESIIQNSSGYIYTQARYPSIANWTLGVSLNTLDDSIYAKSLHSINPKIGLLLDITPNTLFRAAAFRTLNGARLPYQTLEPVQVAGFNQFFDDRPRTESIRWGIGLDHKFISTLSGGLEFSKRHLVRHDLGNNAEDIKSRWQESNYRAYLLWAPHKEWAVSLDYFRENFDNFESFGARDTKSQTIPIGISYFSPSGISVKLKTSLYQQTVYYEDSVKTDNTVFLDLNLGYRLPKRRGIFEIQFQNLLNQNYHYQGLQARTPIDTSGIPSFLPFSPEFTVFTRLTLAF
jgi:tetratricopeptide (TPR) repeat protein